MQVTTPNQNQPVPEISKILASGEPSNQNITNRQEDDSEQDEDDDTIDTTNQENISALTKSALVSKSEDYVHFPNVNEAHAMFQTMRNYLDEILRKERETQLLEFVKEGGEARDFKAAVDEDKNKFYQNFQKFQERRLLEKQNALAEKEKNLDHKKEILEKIKQLVESEETEKSIEQLRDLQREWKQVRQVPKEFMPDLWETYRFYLDKFYDNLNINFELKELDRQKNLETKIDLCLKVDDLRRESNVKKALILLNKYHEEYKNAGPVPNEATDDIWRRFKEASDLVLNEKKDLLNNLKEERNQHLKLKVILCEKMEQLAEIPYEKISEWNKKTDETKAIFEEWKKVGLAPKAFNDSIWKRFRDAMDAFYTNKSLFFEQLNEVKKGNLSIKESLCVKAEALQHSQDWHQTSKILQGLQEEWKNSGPVSEKVSDSIWKRFRAAFDHFYKAKEEVFKGQKESESENYNNKKAMILQVKDLLEEEDANIVFEKLKTIHQQWLSIGHVPFKNKDEIFKGYQSATDEVYIKFKKSRNEASYDRVKEHYESLKNVPNGMNKLKDEERKISGKIKFLEEEVKTIENNIMFFSNSKGSEKILKPFEEKIKQTAQLITKLKEELKIIRMESKANAN